MLRRWRAMGEATMREAFTGCGTALVTPFKRNGSLDEAARVAAGAAPDRRRDPLPGAVRHDRREPDAVRATSGSASSSWSSAEAKGRVPVLAGAGGYDTREVIQAAQRMTARGRRRHPLGDAVLQQADPRGPLPALQGDRRGGSGCRSWSTTCPAGPACNVDPQTLDAARGAPERGRPSRKRRAT